MNKIIEEQINQVIKEELGIANCVADLSKKIERIVYRLIKNGVEYKKFSVSTDVSRVNVNFTHKDFVDKKVAKEWVINSINKYSHLENTIYISVATVNGKISPSYLSDKIQHECYHYFESQKWKKKPFDEILIIKGMHCKNSYLSKICTILYFSIEDEIDAYINGSYASAMKKKRKYTGYKDFIYDNKIFDVYDALTTANIVINNSEDPSYKGVLGWVAENILGCDVKDAPNLILKIANTAYQYFIKKVGKVYSLYLKKLNGDV